MINHIKYKPKFIIFDWDNTLVDSWPLIQESFNHTASILGLKTFSKIEVINQVGYAIRSSFPNIFGDLASKAQEIYTEYYVANYMARLKLLPYAHEILHYLTNLKIPLFIVSNKKGASVRRETKALNINQYFSNIIGSLDTNYDKPNIAPVIKALESHSYNEADTKNILFIGDSLVDYECAQNLGMQSILVNSSSETKVKAAKAKIISDLAELKALI